MSTEITMPKLSDTMTEGTLISWKKGVGEKVEKGDIVAEVETDKAVMELESFSSGILLEKRVDVGDLVDVGTVIAVIGDKGENPSPSLEKESPLREDQMEKSVEKEESPSRPPPPGMKKTTLVKASPAVRRLAREKGIDLEEVEGSGPEGRVLKDDLQEFVPLRKEEKLPGETVSVPLSSMRAAIAEAVTKSWQSIPHFTVTMDIDMSATENVRDCLKETGAHVTITDMIIKAASLALTDFPRLNASFAGNGVIVHPEIRMGVAVEVPDGLLIPVMRNCEVLSLRETALQSREVIGRAREGRLKESEISGGTFAISNLGMYGVSEFMALIPPGMAGVLAVGAIADRVVVRNGNIAPSRMMKTTLSADHRVVDGAYGAKFLGAFRKYLENPAHLLI